MAPLRATPRVSNPLRPAPAPGAGPAGPAPEKYRLANGLTVVLHHDPATPIVHLDVTYHVGSARETPGRSGLAHLCEHLMFEGSRHVAGGEHHRRVQAGGGVANAVTNRDQTSYYQTAPADQLPVLLWLEADRMGFLAEAVTPAALEGQRAVIAQERAQTYDNRPYGRLTEYTGRALYPADHPYAWATIGSLADLAQLTLADVRDFYRRWYGPNNATLTLGGAFDPAAAKAWIAAYFGPIARGAAVPPLRLTAPPLAQDCRLVHADHVRFPLVQLVFPTVPKYHPDALALEALAEIVGQGKNSLLHQQLLVTQRAVQVSATHPASEHAGEFTLTAVAPACAVPHATEQAVRAALASFEELAAPVLDEALLRFRNRREAAVVNQLDNLADRLTHAVEHQVLLDAPDYLNVYLRDVQALRGSDVRRVYAAYLRQRSAVVVHLVPHTDAPAAGAPAPVLGPAPGAPGAVPVPVPVPIGPGLATSAPVGGGIDRRVPPPTSGPRAVPVPGFWRTNLSNGLQLIGTAASAVPSVTMALKLPGGCRLEPATGHQAGVAALTAALLNEGSRRYPSAAFTAALNRLGSTVHVGVGPDATTVYVQSLSKHLGPTLALVEERLLHPRFAPDDFARVKQQALAGIAHRHTQAPALADALLLQCLHAPGDRMGQPLAGTLASVGQLGLAEVQAFYHQAYTPNRAVLAVAGNLGLAQLDPDLYFLHGWAAQVGAPLANPVATTQAPRLYFAHREGAVQAEIRLGCLALPYDATGEYYRATLANFLFGGSFNSRLTQHLRQTHGYAYSVRSGFAGLACPGPFVVQASVRPDAVVAALRGIRYELMALREHVSEAELRFLQTALRQQAARQYETNPQRAFFLNHLVQHQLPADYVRQQHALLAQLSCADVQAFAQRHLPPDGLHTVVVGDRRQVLPLLHAAGYEVVETDPATA